MKTFGSCHLIMNRNYHNRRHGRDFTDADYSHGEITLLHGFHPQTLTSLLATHADKTFKKYLCKISTFTVLIMVIVVTSLQFLCIQQWKRRRNTDFFNRWVMSVMTPVGRRCAACSAIPRDGSLVRETKRKQHTTPSPGVT